MLIPVDVVSFAVDPKKNAPLIVLKESSGEQRNLAIPIGPLEASAIAVQSLDISPDRPLTVDLVKIMMEQLGGTLLRVVIYDFIDQSFYARLQVFCHSSMKIIDCRPCDAIALALRCNVPLFAKATVFEKVHPEKKVSETERLRKDIAAIDTLDFGKYFLE